MDQQGRFRQAALASGIPDDEVSRFAEHLRLSVRLSGGSGGVPVGRFGGSPPLPVGVDWPSEQGGRLPYVFSVDCAALPEVDGSKLPPHGTLLFFLDHEKDHLTEGYGRVVYGTATAQPPDGGYDLSATLVAELPDWMEPRDDDEDEDDDAELPEGFPHLEELRALAYDLWPLENGLASAYLGGYVDDEVITSIAEQTLAGREQAGEIVVPVANWYSHVQREKHRLAGEWMSLARFSADDEFYSGSFVIRHDDLAAGRVDRAFSVTGFSE
ncbi:DUF1963 domain-containing protein [Actinoplanes solisilvae]|uniref:DUF1963 domain-containing protein n=1 Tax=Actinoplanes solisilvae TaxID=2486853 RepID=UPI000FDA81D7|nr:DUF1963 domain-containing protein [Actinoplanes solisilvae]